MKILIVDDEISITKMLSRCLSKLEGDDLQIITAYSAKEGLEVIKDNPDIKIVFIDMCMPNMNGDTACKLMKISNPEIKMFLMTGLETSELKNFEEIEGIIVKPAPIDDFIKAIENER